MNTTLEMNPGAATAPKLKLSRYIGYGLGDFAFNFYWLPLNFFMLKYYTDVLGLSGGVAGFVIGAGLVWDAVIDPAIGVIANKTRSRYGRYRPFMLFGSVPLAISFTLMFFPVPFKDYSLVAYAFATQLLFRTMYGAVNIPYGAMMASMTRDSMERNWLSGARMFFAMSGSAIVGLYTPELIAYFQGSHAGSAHFIATAILSGIAIVVTLVSFAMTEERIETKEETHPPLKDLARMIAANTPFLQAMGAIALFSFTNMVISNALAFFIQYYMNQDLHATGKATGLIPLVQMIAVPFWAIASRYLGKRWAWILGMSIAAVGLLTLYGAEHLNMMTVYVLLGVYAVGCASVAVNFWSMVPDTVEYGQWKTGVRGEGFIFGFVTLIQKIALGASAAFVGGYLTWIGYVPNQPQTAETLEGLKLLICVISLFGLVASCVVVYFYRLDAKEHARIVGEIAKTA